MSEVVASPWQEKEELAKLRLRADDLVNKAYFRYAGAHAKHLRPALTAKLLCDSGSNQFCPGPCPLLALHAAISASQVVSSALVHARVLADARLVS
jgi:hypothetical protein